METLTRLVHVIDPISAFLDNRMNPLLVRELRQLVRNRFVIVMLNLYIGVLVLASLMVVGFTADFTQASGQDLFSALAVILSVAALLVVVPYTGLVTAMERINDDLMFTSAIRPSSIIWGKFLNGIIISLLLFSVTLPFFTFANQLRGLDMYEAGAIVWLIFLGLHIFNALAILVFSGVRSYVQLVVCAGGMLVAAGFVASVGLALLLDTSSPLHRSVGGLTWENLLLFTLVGVMGIAVLLSAAIANVAPPTTNRATPFRVTVTSVYAGSLLLAVYFQTSIGATEALKIWVFCMSWTLVPLTIMAVCERDRLGVRIRATIPRFPPLRVFAFPFYSGAPNALVWVALLGTGILLIAFQLEGVSPLVLPWPSEILNPCYAVVFLFDYCITAMLLRSWFFPKGLTHQMTWLLVGLLLTFMIVGGLLGHLVTMNDDLGSWDYEETAFAAPNPFLLINRSDAGFDVTGVETQRYCALFWGMALLPFFLFWFLPRIFRFRPVKVDRATLEADAAPKE